MRFLCDLWLNTTHFDTNGNMYQKDDNILELLNPLIGQTTCVAGGLACTGLTLNDDIVVGEFEAVCDYGFTFILGKYPLIGFVANIEDGNKVTNLHDFKFTIDIVDTHSDEGLVGFREK